MKLRVFFTIHSNPVEGADAAGNSKTVYKKTKTCRDFDALTMPDDAIKQIVTQYGERDPQRPRVGEFCEIFSHTIFDETQEPNKLEEFHAVEQSLFDGVTLKNIQSKKSRH